LLYQKEHLFFENDVSIFSARINTLGDRVEDTFEIENFEHSLVEDKKIKNIVAALEKVV